MVHSRSMDHESEEVHMVHHPVGVDHGPPIWTNQPDPLTGPRRNQK